MTNDIIDLIQAEIDGQNSPDATRRLEEACRQDPAIQKERESAHAIGKALDTLSDARPPDGFAARVMSALPDEPSWAKNRRPAAAPSRSAIRLTRRPWLNVAYGLVVGVFVTIAAMSALQGDSTSIDGARGTMMLTDSEPTIQETIDIDDTHAVDVIVSEDASGISARIEGLLPEGSHPSIVIEIAGGGQITIPIRTP